MKNALEHMSFSALADRAGALYNGERDALLLAMLGQEYVIRHAGITLRGQKAPDIHELIILEYLFSTGTSCVETPWRSLGDMAGQPVPEFRKRVEQPIAQHVAEFIPRAGTILPHFDGVAAPSLIGSDMAMTVLALPKVHLRVELSQEDQEFPPEAWVLFSNNADSFLSVPTLQSLGELFKDRLLSLLRIY
jgi:hypothetical protein